MTVLDELIHELCPDGVKYKALGEICKLVTGATPSKTNAAYWENGTIPWMSSGEVNLKRVAATEKKITETLEKIYRKIQLADCDLFGIKNTLYRFHYPRYDELKDNIINSTVLKTNVVCKAKSTTRV